MFADSEHAALVANTSETVDPLFLIPRATPVFDSSIDSATPAGNLAQRRAKSRRN